MPEGTIKRLMSDKGFGFIKLRDSGSDYFFHKSYLSKGCRFDDLSEGDVVQFELRPSTKKPGQQEAFDIKPTRGMTVAQKTIHPSAQSAPSSKRTALPYGFIPIDPDRAIIDSPVLHDGSSGGELLSGEILCELEALTPLLPGNSRYAVKDADRQHLRQWGFVELPESKQIAEPLRLPDGRVVIAGSALKGMIRQSLGALTSAPMERVGERHFTYRPNLELRVAGSQKYVVRPARVLSKKSDGWAIEVFDNPQSALFVRKGAESVIRDASSNGLIQGNVSGVEVEMKPRRDKPPIKTNHLIPSKRREYFDHRLVAYKGGIDGQGLLAAAFNDGKRGSFTYDLALVPRQAVCTLHIDTKLYQRYLDDQYNILANDKIGHLTAHPLSSKSEFDANQVAQAIRQHAEWEAEQLIYVELTTDAQGEVTQESQVVSCGHHFRYRWAYTSSIREQNGQPRACLTPIADEQTAGKPERLTGARLLFGYVRDDKTNPIGQGVFERLAGRIAINHAVSVDEPCFLGDEETGYCIPLKILGQPKPSAWEFYLQQPEDLSKPLNTYGDLPDNAGGELAGRKFYRHQPDTSQFEIEASVDQNDQSDSKSKIDLVNTDQATLARYICQTGTRFRFAIRFARLRPWELGALLAVLEPHHLAPDGKSDDYAHKLGLGRPLGMGSVRIKRQAVRIRTENEITFLEYSARESLLRIALDALKKRLNNDQVQQWLSAHRMVKGQRLGYPPAETKDKDGKGKGDWSIYNWHTDVRRQYSQLRRQGSPKWSDLAGKIRSKR